MTDYIELYKRYSRSKKDEKITITVPGWLSDMLRETAGKDKTSLTNLLCDYALKGLSEDCQSSEKAV